jgi:hypothetical protein
MREFEALCNTAGINQAYGTLLVVLVPHEGSLWTSLSRMAISTGR